MSSLYDGMREHAKQVSIDTEIAGGGGTITGTNTGDVVINLASGVPSGAVTLTAQTVTFTDAFVYNTGTNNIGTQGDASDDVRLE